MLYIIFIDIFTVGKIAPLKDIEISVLTYMWQY